MAANRNTRSAASVWVHRESFALVKKDMIELYDFSGKPLPVQVSVVDIQWAEQEKQGHAHYMLKEIYEQKTAIINTSDFLRSLHNTIWEHLGLTKEKVHGMTSITMIGCGTSWHAARIAQFFFESICRIPVRVHLASEFRYKPFFPDQKSLYFFISQSGETADSLEALRLISAVDMPTIAVTNVASSTMVQEADGFLLTQAGAEIAVASTKAFSTQIAALYWLAHRIALRSQLAMRRGVPFRTAIGIAARRPVPNPTVCPIGLPHPGDRRQR